MLIENAPSFREALPFIVLAAVIVTLILFIFIASVVILIKAAQRLYSFGHQRQFRALTALLLLLVAFVLLFLSRAAMSHQGSLVRSWEKRAGPIRETNPWLGRVFGVFGPPPNRYEIDLWGRVTELHLQNLPIKSLDELPEINQLTSLRVLAVSGTPLEGVLDVSSFTQLREIHLRGTRITELRGLEGLLDLTVLELDGSSMGAAESLDLTMLRSASQLEQLSLTSFDLRNVIGLTEAWSIKKLDLSHCVFVPFEQIAQLNSLQELKLDYSDVRKLGALRPLTNLQSISIVGVAIENVDDFEDVWPAFVDARETSLKIEDVEKEVKHPMAMVYGDRAFWTKVQQEQQERSVRFRRLAYATLLFAVLLYLPAPRNWQRYPFLVVRRIGRRLIFGLLFIVWLQPGVYSEELPIHFFNFEKPFLLNIFTPQMKNLWAAFAGFVWFVMIPLVDVSLESKMLGTTHWGPAIQRLSRFLPVIAVTGPIFLGVAILFVVMIQPLKAPITFIFVIPLLLILGGAMVMGLIVYLPSQLWKDRLRDFNSLLTKAADSTQKKLMVVALHYNVVGTDIRASLASLYDSIRYDVAARNPRMSHLLLVPNIGMLGGVSARADWEKSVSGVIFFLPHTQLEQARSWELELLRDWTISIYQHSNVPVWIVADWIDDTATKSAALVANVKRVTSLLPYLSGLEKNLQADPLIIIRNPPESIDDCLTANKLTAQATREAKSINKTIEQAFTPVSSLIRVVFSYASLLDRLDVLLRATELSIAYFTLVLAIDFEQHQSEYQPNEAQQLERIIASLDGQHTFSSWQSLLLGLVKRTRSSIAGDLRETLAAPAPAQAGDLIPLLIAIGGSTEGVSNEISSLQKSLDLLRALRNVTIAHGPASARIGEELYTKTLATVADFISGLPWRRATIQHVSPAGLVSTFKGCLPAKSKAESKPQGVYLVSEEQQVVLDASKYFCYVSEVDSVAVYMGKDGYLEPLSGIRIPT